MCLSEVVCQFPRHALPYVASLGHGRTLSGAHDIIYVTVSVNRLNFTHPETNIFKINEYK